MKINCSEMEAVELISLPAGSQSSTWNKITFLKVNFRHYVVQLIDGCRDDMINMVMFCQLISFFLKHELQIAVLLRRPPQTSWWWLASQPFSQMNWAFTNNLSLLHSFSRSILLCMMACLCSRQGHTPINALPCTASSHGGSSRPRSLSGASWCVLAGWGNVWPSVAAVEGTVRDRTRYQQVLLCSLLTTYSLQSCLCVSHGPALVLAVDHQLKELHVLFTNTIPT